MAPDRLVALPPLGAPVPSRDDGVTITCPVCGGVAARSGRRRFCSAACRQAAWRRRQVPQAPDTLALPTPSRRDQTVYECPTCQVRFLGEQRCPDCNVFCRRIGPGGPCPHCDEPVVLTDLVEGMIQDR